MLRRKNYSICTEQSFVDWIKRFILYHGKRRPLKMGKAEELTPTEARAVLAQLEGTKWLVASLLYGSNLRLMECLRLRVKDVDFGCGQMVVRDAKGCKDRVEQERAGYSAVLPAL